MVVPTAWWHRRRRTETLTAENSLIEEALDLGPDLGDFSRWLPRHALYQSEGVGFEQRQDVVARDPGDYWNAHGVAETELRLALGH